ncbi:helix-turn-helix domain-containing protein [Clostridium estertheticum]|uniref:sugar diacid recognition domain-containing protein n=1 Tax=Clostridium estertheticum TaxID=238834 RepID=UPI001CF52301|nr:sugar diacid recognition domain-containing protein [Clostridium estertheticum]MCB2308107.1 helix-turn-helix domain-containing protein [Clostridium estertheticum]MCB2346313.1 helix-turn-helix domain-containing protein [Clostridium estertheticum]MCB2349495.1 helix-turn-helix domain-containing protein [Clostridium estertheticum]WAG46469.1 helix-turn-helix domain-containing protein [Clostridium estertheticum]
MEILSSKLAKNIVERTMGAVGYNIIITNTLGIIIASGDKNRIGDIHEGAIIALKRNSEFSVSEHGSEKLNGVHSGTNLVIEFQNKVVGVIGITGNPSAVLGYGKLIKMTAEMMIEQEHVLTELESNKRMKQEVMLALIYNKQDSLSLLKKHIKGFEIPYNYPMFIFVIEVNFKDNSNKIDLNMLNIIITLLEVTFMESLATIINSQTIVVLHKCLHINNEIEDYNEKIKEINEKISTQLGVTVKISVGKTYDNLNDMYKSYSIAKETLIFGEKIYPNHTIYFFNSLKSEMLFSQNNEKWKIDELAETYKLVALNDNDGVLRETLKVLIEENGELNNVSNRLFIHRNTIRYRLNKIHKITNKNPRNYTDLFWLYSAMLNS